MLAAQDFGPFDNLVGTAGAVIAMGSALRVSWKGRAKWEPSEEDVPRGAQKVGGLVASGLIALMWAEWRGDGHASTLDTVIVVTLILTVVFLLVYGYLIGVQTYKVIQVGRPDRKVIGGFWLTTAAKKSKAKNDFTTQELLEGAEYDVEQLWSRGSRQLAKTCFLAAYLGLTICGTLALAATALRVGIAV